MTPTSRKPFPLVLAGLAAVVAVTLAARAPQGPAPAAQGTAPAAPAAAQDSAKPAADSAPAADSLAPADSTAPADSAAAPAPVVAAPPAPAPGTWPVDPVTGQTLINGIPVVGRVFIMHKTDHLQKMGTVDQVLAQETGAPEPPATDDSYTPAPRAFTRQFRGIMVQATLWDMDHKRTATERRYYRP